MVKRRLKVGLLTALLGIVTVPVLTACSLTTFSNSDNFGKGTVVVAQQEQLLFTMPQNQAQAAQLIRSWVKGTGGNFDTAAFEKEQEAFEKKNKDDSSSTGGTGVFWSGINQTNFGSAKTEVETAIKANLAVKGFVLHLYELSHFYFKHQASKFGSSATTTFNGGFTTFKLKVSSFINSQNNFLERDFAKTVSQLKTTVARMRLHSSSSSDENNIANVPWLKKSVSSGSDDGKKVEGSDQNLKVNGEAGDTKVTTAQAKTIYQKFWQVFKGIHDVMYQDYQASAKFSKNSVTFKQQYQKGSNYQKQLNTYYYAAFWYNIYFGEQSPKVSEEELKGTIETTNDITSYTNLGINVDKKFRVETKTKTF